MHLIRLQIRRFRNIATLDWTPAPGVNLIVGRNGQGKTNTLEAIFFGLLGRSFRTRREEECLPRGKPPDPERPTAVQVELKRKSDRRRLRVTLGAGAKRVHADGAIVGRLADLWRGAAVVTFAPEDVDLFRQTPGGRRRFLDQALSHLSPAYLDHLSRYQKALRQTNAALKGGAGDRAARARAEAYYPLLGASGAELMHARAEHLTALGRAFAARYRSLGGDGELKLDYEPNPRLNGRPTTPAEAESWRPAAALSDRLAELHDESARQGAIAVGPHRDDWRAQMGGFDLGRFGSQGENRLAALALKLASADLLAKGLGDPPILLLDDFGSELDAARRRGVLGGLRGKMQVFITATESSALGPETLFDRIERIRDGAWVEG